MIKEGIVKRLLNKEIVAFNELSSDQPSHRNGPNPNGPRENNRGFHHERVLILNSSYQPVKLVNWQKALLLWFQDKVEILEYHASHVRSARDSFQLPSVLRLKKYISPRKTVRLKFSRENIYLRDNYTWQYCGEQLAAKELTLDHVVPASKFGKKDWTNMVTACRTCNHRKANRTPLGAGMPLLSEPRIPNWLPSLRPEFAAISENMPETWRAYLGVG